MPNRRSSSTEPAPSGSPAIALIPGAGGLGWYWHLVEAELRSGGYDAFAVDFAARGVRGLPAYADAVVDAVGARESVALVALSLGAFTVPLTWDRVPTSALVFVNAMIPQPGERPDEWWANVDSESARIAAARRDGYPVEFDLATYFTHDVSEELAAEMGRRADSQLSESFDDVCAFERWPAVPIHAIAGREDRFFPLELQRRVARERLGVEPRVVPGGHLASLSHPAELSATIAEVVQTTNGSVT